ncbi:MAG TPA: DUF364 domain-containing protein [Fibrobacteraceae bacterium]|nr:DUF364 domain-containing protein [Fibrobacteraceae bacterium]
MPFYSGLKLRFANLCHDREVLQEPVQVKIDSTYSEHSGAALAGRSRMIATFRGHPGISYTFHPYQFEGTVEELLQMELEGSADRAVFIAGMNAVCGWANPQLRTVHCSDDGSLRCTQRLVKELKENGYDCPGLIGFQPSFLKALGKGFGNWNTACVDQSEVDESIRRSADIDPLDEEHLKQLISWSDVIVVTGATLVSGTLPDILEWAEMSGIPALFYGTSIAGAADLMGLPRFCPEARSVLFPEALAPELEASVLETA